MLASQLKLTNLVYCEQLQPYLPQEMSPLTLHIFFFSTGVKFGTEMCI
jgi:hypothetical protein